MRSRETIEKDRKFDNERVQTVLIIEILLDIRDILLTP